MRESRKPTPRIQPDTSSFTLHPLTLTSRPKKLLHDFSALFLKHTGCNINPVIQEIRIANSKLRFDGAGPLVARAIHQPFHARLYQRARTHYTRFNCRINHRVCEAVVINAARRLSERYDFRMCGRILIRLRSVSSNREYRSTGNDAGTDGNLTTLSRLICRAESLLHPMPIRFSFPGSTHDRNIRVKQRKIYYRWGAQTLSSESFLQQYSTVLSLLFA